MARWSGGRLSPGTAAQVAFHELLRLRCLIRPDGKIVVGIATASNSVIALLNSNGSVDASFGSGGTLVTSWMNGVWHALLITGWSS